MVAVRSTLGYKRTAYLTCLCFLTRSVVAAAPLLKPLPQSAAARFRRSMFPGDGDRLEQIGIVVPGRVGPRLSGHVRSVPSGDGCSSAAGSALISPSHAGQSAGSWQASRHGIDRPLCLGRVIGPRWQQSPFQLVTGDARQSREGGGPSSRTVSVRRSTTARR